MEAVDRLERNNKIRAMRESGMTYAQIQAKTGLGHGAIGQIVRRLQTREGIAPQPLNHRQFGWMPILPADAADKIRKKCGDDYADDLCLFLNMKRSVAT